MKDRLANIVAATNLAVEVPTGTETGIHRNAFQVVACTLHPRHRLDMSRSNPTGERISSGGAVP